MRCSGGTGKNNNDSLVRRGEVYISLDSSGNWDEELEKM